MNKCRTEISLCEINTHCITQLYNFSKLVSLFSLGIFVLFYPPTINVRHVMGFSLFSFFLWVPMWLCTHPAEDLRLTASPRVSLCLSAPIIDLSITFCCLCDCDVPAGLTGRLMPHFRSSLYSDALAQQNNGTINGDTRIRSHRLEDWRGGDDTPRRWKPSRTCLSPEGIFHPRPSI